MEIELIKPRFQTRPYKASEVCRIKDRWQSFLYIKHGANPVDLYVDGDDNLVMLFLKDETRELYDAYRKYQLK